MEVLADGDCAHSQLLRRRGDLSPGEQDGMDDGGDAGEGEGGWARRHDAQSCLERWADMVRFSSSPSRLDVPYPLLFFKTSFQSTHAVVGRQCAVGGSLLVAGGLVPDEASARVGDIPEY
ncbi:hypothetical protein E4U43_006254 [Claviceps pusilla]|uniref:Uncharacterized protein n=1 Tax=Claviceps pusilla TaxID=123648 RepID=A0A9P7N210_9HYPO|nr:hypothetical protein E4U43_006254 [Claviceps pusilla]